MTVGDYLISSAWIVGLLYLHTSLFGTVLYCDAYSCIETVVYHVCTIWQSNIISG